MSPQRMSAPFEVRYLWTWWNVALGLVRNVLNWLYLPKTQIISRWSAISSFISRGSKPQLVELMFSFANLYEGEASHSVGSSTPTSAIKFCIHHSFAVNATETQVADYELCIRSCTTVHIPNTLRITVVFLRNTWLSITILILRVVYDPLLRK